MRTYLSIALASLAIAICTTAEVPGFQEPAMPEPSQAFEKALQQKGMLAKPDLAKPAAAAVASPAASLTASPGAAAQPVQASKAQMMPTKTPAGQSDGMIRFSFSRQDWSDVIPWFAAQANLSLQPVADFPDGVFTLKDDSEYTVLEALDQLNHALRIRQPEPYTLIRNRNMLVLWKLRDANFPNDLIETVKVEDLDKRGKHETISCIFDVGELDAQDIGGQIQRLVNGNKQPKLFCDFPNRQPNSCSRNWRTASQDPRPD